MKKISILLVEDEGLIREELSLFLRRYTQEELYLAADGEEGLQKYKEHTPDVVISDIKMPKMTGIEMVKEIKKIDPEQIIVFTTAHSDSDFFLEAIEIQVDGYLLKPIDLGYMEKKLHEIIQNLELKDKYNEQKIITNEIAHLQGNMLAVLDEKLYPVFVNDKLLAFWSIGSMKDIIKNNHTMGDRFVQHDGCFYPVGSGKDWLEEIQEVDPSERMVMIADAEGLHPKTYMVNITFVEKSRHTIVVFSEITHIANKQTQYKKEALTDELTNINNRKMFNIKLEEEMTNVKESHIPLSIILFDVDYFKAVNDNYGHLIGDDVLVTLTEIVQKKLRITDLFARWGGEEFVILLPNTDIVRAEIVAENLREMIQKHIFKKNITLTCSFGIAQMYKGATPKKLLEMADLC